MPRHKMLVKGTAESSSNVPSEAAKTGPLVGVDLKTKYKQLKEFARKVMVEKDSVEKENADLRARLKMSDVEVKEDGKDFQPFSQDGVDQRVKDLKEELKNAHEHIALFKNDREVLLETIRELESKLDPAKPEKVEQYEYHTEVCVKFERWYFGLGWHRPGWPASKWTDAKGNKCSKPERFLLPVGWEWVEPEWKQVVKEGEDNTEEQEDILQDQPKDEVMPGLTSFTDKEGWQYSQTFTWPSWHATMHTRDLMRRRVHVRTRRRKITQ